MCLSLSLSCGCSVFDYVCLLIMSVCCWYWQHDLIPVLCQEGGAQRSCGFWAVGHDMNSPCVCLWRMDMKTCLQREADHNQVAVPWCSCEPPSCSWCISLELFSDRCMLTCSSQRSADAEALCTRVTDQLLCCVSGRPGSRETFRKIPGGDGTVSARGQRHTNTSVRK